jgi:hypothetical protein
MARKMVDDQDDADVVTGPPQGSFDEEVDRLIQGGFMPLPALRLVTGKPVWDIGGIAELFTLPPEKLLAVLRENGPVHVRDQPNIPSSWELVRTMHL